MQPRDSNRRRTIQSAIAVQKHAMLLIDQLGQGVQSRSESHSHIVGATVMDRRANEMKSEAFALAAQFGRVETIDMQIDIVLQIMDRADAILLFQPLQIIESRVFTHE